MDGDDLVPGLEQRFIDRQEVAERGRRGAGEALQVAQPLVVLIEVGDVDLGPRLLAHMHVETDLMDLVSRHELGGEVMAGVSDDGGGHDGGHPTSAARLALSQCPGPSLPAPPASSVLTSSASWWRAGRRSPSCSAPRLPWASCRSSGSRCCGPTFAIGGRSAVRSQAPSVSITWPARPTWPLLASRCLPSTWKARASCSRR